MSKKITFSLDDDVINELDGSLKIDDVVINQAIQQYVQAGKLNVDQTSEMAMKMQMLTQDKQKIEQEKKELEIEYACIKQQKNKLESRINDLSELYPSANVILGKKPVADYSRMRLFKNRRLKKK
ncbi:MAG: hypothetical protein DRN27_03745 [Thermoplasmata archaeon]|nr:MAG: hypothetical protein DRN27_03745 [Thermoplasmata archaeon]